MIDVGSVDAFWAALFWKDASSWLISLARATRGASRGIGAAAGIRPTTGIGGSGMCMMMMVAASHGLRQILNVGELTALRRGCEIRGESV